MNREQKAAAVAEIAAQIDQSHAIFAVDYRGISVPQVAELRARLREADATFKVVKNSLTERAADQSGAEPLKPLLTGPTALTFVRGDAATAAKAIADYGRASQLLPFKGGLMDGAALDGDQIRALSRLPARDVLYGQLVGVVASPVTGLVRTLSALLGGLAVALGQVREKMQSGEIPQGAASAAAAEAVPAAEEAQAAEEQPVAPLAAEEAQAPEQQPEAAPAAEEAQAPEGEAAPEAEAAQAEDEAAPQAETPQAEGEAAAEAEAPQAEDEAAAEAEQPESEAGEGEGATAGDEASESVQPQAEASPEAQGPEGAAEENAAGAAQAPQENDDDETGSSAEAPQEGADGEPAKED